jgi:hypothetical protein
VNDMQAIDRTQALRAKVALEEVCSGARLACAPEFYSSHIVDHVDGAEHRGHEGIRRSVQAYAGVLSDLRTEVKGGLALFTDCFEILSLCEHCLPGEWMRVD